MSDLSLLSTLTSGDEPALPRPQGAAAFVWPMPALAAYPVPAPQAAAEPCEIEGRSGQVMQGQLVSFNAAQAVVQVLLPGEAASLPLQLGQIRRVTLTRVIAPLAAANRPGAGEPPPQVAAPHASQRYAVHWSGGGTLQGQTIGHAELPLGLFVFPPAPGSAAPGAVIRSFFPRAAFDRHDIGAPLGEVLVQQAAATPQQVDEAVAAQRKLRSRKIGELLVAARVVTMEQLFAALDKQARLPMMRLGDALVALGHVTEDELVEALRRQDHDRQLPLGTLLEQRGLISRAALHEALAQKMGYPLVDLAAFPRDPGLLHRLPLAVARRLDALPLIQYGGRIVVAMADPTQRSAVEELEHTLGAAVAPVLASQEGLREILAAADAPVVAVTAERPPVARLAAPAPAAPGLHAAAAAEGDSDGDGALLAALTRLVDDALQRGASDIHIERHAGDQPLRVRLRREGRLEPAQPLPPACSALLPARLKALAGMDPGFTRKAQAGQLDPAQLPQLQHPLHLPEGEAPPRWPAGAVLQLTTLPLHDGLEDLVIRLPGRVRLRRLDQLGLSSRDHARLTPLLDRPGGLLMVVGPARSGRTSTLHAMLHRLTSPERTLYTAEERLDILQPSLRQVAVDARHGWGMAEALEAFRSADADVVMVGELRDARTARLALELAGAGTLVLAGAPGRCAAEAVMRLGDIGADPYQLADALIGVQAQRLVRRPCRHCRMSRPARDTEVAEWLDAYLEQGLADEPARAQAGRDALLQDWLVRRGRDGRLKRYHSAGCDQCQGTGRRGHTAVHELLVVTREMRRLVRAHAPAWHLQRQALRDGMRTLRQDAIEKMLAGVVPVSELRLLADLTP